MQGELHIINDTYPSIRLQFFG